MCFLGVPSIITCPHQTAKTGPRQRTVFLPFSPHSTLSSARHLSLTHFQISLSCSYSGGEAGPLQQDRGHLRGRGVAGRDPRELRPPTHMLVPLPLVPGYSARLDPQDPLQEIQDRPTGERNHVPRRIHAGKFRAMQRTFQIERKMKKEYDLLRVVSNLI